MRLFFCVRSRMGAEEQKLDPGFRWDDALKARYDESKAWDHELQAKALDPGVRRDDEREWAEFVGDPRVLLDGRDRGRGVRPVVSGGRVPGLERWCHRAGLPSKP